METLDSIIENKPDEIILVYDHTDKKLMEDINEIYGKKIRSFLILKPGKRSALAEGIRKAKSELVILVDSDTSWTSKDFLKNLIKPFANPEVGGVGTRQKVKGKSTDAQKLIDWILDIKYSDYVSSDSLSGSVLCLSGRTAAYRREIVIPLLNDLENEYFLGHKCLGGDDARLTSLVLQQGYKTLYQDNAVAISDFDPSLLVYLKQKVRWSRNSFRTYLRSIFSEWPWKQKRIYYLMSAYYTVVQGIALLLGLILLFYTFYLGFYSLFVLFFIWSFVSRGIKSYTHLKKEPKDIALLPLVVFYFYVLSFIKIYALFTMTKESWTGSRGEYKIKKGQRVVKTL